MRKEVIDKIDVSKETGLQKKRKLYMYSFDDDEYNHLEKDDLNFNKPSVEVSDQSAE